MPGESMVVEDGTGELKTKPRAKSGWFVVLVGFALGLALGTLIAAPRDAPNATGAQEPTTAGTVAEPPEDVTEGGVSASIPGFPDALVAVGDSLGSGHDYLLWPVGGPLVTRSMTGGVGVQLDATGQFIALSEVVPDLPGSLMSMGRFNGMRPVSVGVTSYAWHDAESGDLAYTTEDDEEWRLYRVTGSFVPSLVVAGPPNGGTVSAWGDWGFAIQLPNNRVQLLTRAGEPKDMESGVALASHESGWILFDDDGLKLVSGGGGVRRLNFSEVPEAIFAASISPDGSQVAVAGRLGFVVFDVDDAEATKTVSGAPGNWVTWSSDSRFVVAPARRGVSIYDRVREESHHVLPEHTIVAAEVLPLSSRRDG